MKRVMQKVLLAVVCLLWTVVFTNRASAVVNNADIMKKWIFTQYYTCIRDQDLKGHLKRVVEQEESGKVIDGIFESGNSGLVLPSYNFQHTLGTTGLSCKDLFTGTSRLMGVMGYAGWSGSENISWSNVSNSQAFLNKLGYSIDKTGGNGEMRFTINAKKKTKVQTAFGGDATDWQDGGAASVVIVAEKGANGKTKYDYSGWENLFSDIKISTSGGDFTMELTLPVSVASACSVPDGAVNERIIVPLNDNVDEFFGDLKRAIDNTVWVRYCGNGYAGTRESYEFVGDSAIDAGENGDFVYAEGSNSYDVSNNVIKDNMSTGMSISGLALTDSEKYVLYVYYLNSFLPDDGVERITCSTDGSGSVWLKDTDGVFKKCSINLSGVELRLSNEVNTQYFEGRNRQPYPYIGTITIQGVIDWLATVDTSKLTDVPTPSSINGRPNSGGNSGGNNGGETEVCYANSGKLGWILCPIIQGASAIGERMWTQIEDYHMQIPASAVFQEDGGVYKGWTALRDIGNIAFVILLLFVIFSQLTGVGIDNYGIKKILPKLILVAILANLSWVGCELAVDVSNIFGKGLNSMLSSFASNAATAGGASLGSEISGWLTVGALSAGGVGIFLLLNPAGALVAAASIGLAVLGIVISIVVAMLTLYVILLVREAGVILMIILAPVAIVCFALPNTEKLAKKWLNIFKALLVVYPICGAVIGAGQLAGAVMASVDNPGMKVAAMLVQVLPFFLIPTLLRNSLALLGNVGARLSNLGRNIGRRGSNLAQRGIRNTNAFKEWEKYQTNRAGMQRAMRIRNRNDRRVDRGLSSDAERRELQTLRDKIRSGNATDEDRRRYNELRRKSDYQPSEWQERRVSDANAMIREYESNREKASHGVDDVVVAGQMQSDIYANQRAVDEAYDWGEQYFRDNDGNTWVSDHNGNYTTVDQNGVRQTRTAAQIAKMVKDKQGQMVSRRTAMLNRDEVSRSRQTGALAGYANASRTQAASAGARLSSVEASQAEMIRDAQSGQDNVLMVQHEENVAKRREVAGRARASEAFRAQGLDTVVSAEAAQQVAESHLANVAAQNLSADDYANKARAGVYDSRVVRDEAVLAGAIRNANQITGTIASNNPSLVSSVSKDYAESLARERFNTTEEKMFSEQLINNSRAQSLIDLDGAIGYTVSIGGTLAPNNGDSHIGDTNYIRAALKDVYQKGGVEDLNSFIKNASAIISSNASVADTVNNFMTTVVEPEMKAYGKYAVKVTGGGGVPLSYDAWLKAADNVVADPSGEQSLAGFIRVNGDTALVNAGEDTFKFYAKDPTLMSKFSPLQVLNGALSAKENKTRIAAENMLKNRITSDADLKLAIEGISTSQWANMEESTFRTLLNGRSFSSLPPDLQSSFKAIKQRLDKTSGTVTANMRKEVRDFYNSIP